MYQEIARRCEEILRRVPPGVTVLAATKDRSPQEIRAALITGIKHIGENYGPYSVTAGGFYPSWNWSDWWENTPHPYFGVTGPGGPVVY